MKNIYKKTACKGSQLKANGLPSPSYSQKQPLVTVSDCSFTTLEMLVELSGTSVLIALYNPFYFYKVSSDISTSISDVSNLSLLFLLWSV